MFKQTRQDPVPQQRRRATLPTLSTAPLKGDLQVVLTEAQNNRGVLIEVPIRREQPPVFVLTCQWDATAGDPNWALYEGEDGSKSLWSYPNSDLEMVYEMISMSIPTTKNTGPLPTELAPPPTPSPQQEQSQQQQHTQPSHQQPQPGFGTPVAPYPSYGQPAPYPAQQPPYPPQGYPQQGYPQQPYPPAQGYPQQPYPPQGYPQQPYPPQAVPPGWGQQQPPYPAYPAQQPPYGAPGYPAHQDAGPAPQQAPAPQPAPSHSPLSAGADELKPTDLAGFVDLLNKGTGNLLVGHLLVEAGVVPEPCLDAALKIQEFVRRGELSNTGAIEALRLAAEHGGRLTDDIVAKCRAMYPVGSSSAANLRPPSAARESGPLDPREAARQAIMLIQQSGIVTENDITTAEGVRRKHGGEVGNILVAAGKIEKATLDAARQCQPLVREHRLNSDEAARILQHCQKTKATVEDACRELSIRPM